MSAVCPGVGAGAGGRGVGAAVVIVSMKSCCSSEAWPEAETKVAAELQTLGIRVESIGGVSASDKYYASQLAAALEENEVAGALRIVRTTDGTATADLL